MKQKELVQIDNVTKMYSNEKGIKDITFTIKQNEIHGLIGLNGAGKTSIIKSILNIVSCDSGSISWENKEITNTRDINYRKNIGYVPDDEVLLDHLTPMEILKFVGSTYGMNMETIEKRAGTIFDLLDLTEVHTNVDGFSRGMRKKVQLASALISKPKLLILDEPVSGFDPNVIYLLKQLFSELKGRGSSLLISTHDLSFANEICDKVTFIQNGKVLLTGKIDDLLDAAKCNSLEELFISKTLGESSRERLKNVVDNL